MIDMVLMLLLILTIAIGGGILWYLHTHKNE
jgi:hypothetical protein